MMHDGTRASDAERDAVVEQLKAATVDGRLSTDELAGRIADTQSAVTTGELARVTADLPAVRPARAPSPAASSGAAASGVTVFGDLRRGGAWRVPARSRWNTGFGDVRLDLREAELAEDEIVISAGTVFGDVEVLVPPGVVVELAGRTLFGDVREDDGAARPAGVLGPRVVVRATTLFGDVRVRRY